MDRLNPLDALFVDAEDADPQRSMAIASIAALDGWVPSHEESLVLRSDDGNWIWIFSLAPEGTATRLISRNRIARPGASGPVRALTTYLMEPGSLVMERNMLLGIKQRAERTAHRHG